MRDMRSMGSGPFGENRKYSIIMWRDKEPENAAYSEISRRAYDTLCVFKGLPEPYQPKNWCAESLEEVTGFVWSYEEFCKKHYRSESDAPGIHIEMPHLGYDASLFSTMDATTGTRYSFHFGDKEKRYFPSSYNRAEVYFPTMLPMNDAAFYRLIDQLFRRAVAVFEPFWAIIRNGRLPIASIRYIDKAGEAPKNLFWVNYLSEEIVEKLGAEKVRNISQVFPAASFKDGFLQLQERPLDADKPEDIEYRSRVEKYLLT